MNFSDGFIKIMDDVAKRIGVTIDWTSKNVIPYIEQLSGKIVNYEIATSALEIAIGIILYIIAIGCLKMMKKSEGYDKEIWLIPIAVCVVIGTLMIYANAFDIITALTLPEKTILEFIMQIKNTI